MSPATRAIAMSMYVRRMRPLRLRPAAAAGAAAAAAPVAPTHVGQAAPGLPTFLAVLHVGDGDFEGLKLLVSEKVERLVNRWCREAEEEPLEEGTELVAALLVGGSREAHDDEELHAALQADAEGYATAAVLTCAPHQLAPRAGEALGSFPLSNPSPRCSSFLPSLQFLGIPHALNVLSNAAIAVPGVFGLLVLVVSAARSLSRRAPQPLSDDAADPCWAASCVGMLLTAAGSAYYHLAPDTPRLAWDRLGMAVAFASLFAAALAERRIRSRDGATMALALLLATAGGSVAHWRTSEEEGRGDLRAYALVQGLSGSAAERSGSTRALLRALAWYAAAIVCDRTDWIIYKLTAQVVSGHTLKHLLAGVAGWEVVRMLRARASVAGAV
eukprot:scaffold15.g4300.t1